jgi:hypothetical protein
MRKLSANQIRILSAITLLLGMLLPFIGLGNDFTHRDEAYQALCVANYADCPLAMLSFYIGNVWTRLFGDEILSLRILMLICYEFSIAIACVYMYRHTRKLFTSAMMFLIMCLGCRYFTLGIYGWDAGAYPAMTLTTVALLSYANNPSLKRIALVGIAAALSAMSRIPTMAILPVILIVIIYKRRDLSATLRDSGLGLLSFVLTAFLVILLMTSGHPSLYIAAWSPENIINGHCNIHVLIWRFTEVSYNLIPAFMPMAVCAAAACYMTRVQRHIKLNFAICLVGCTLTSYLFFVSYTLDGIYAVGILQGLFIAMILLPWMRHSVHNRPVDVNIQAIIIIVACSLMAAVGSDGFPERPMVINTIPLLWAYLYRRYSAILNYLIVFALFASISFYYFDTTSHAKNISRDFSERPHLRGIRTNELYSRMHVEIFTEISNVMDSIADNSDCAIFGTDRYMLDYVLNNGVSYNLNHFHYIDSPKDIQLISGLIGRRYLIEVHQNINLSSYKATEQFIISNGYKLSRQGVHYRLFERL